MRKINNSSVDFHFVATINYIYSSTFYLKILFFQSKFIQVNSCNDKYLYSTSVELAQRAPSYEQNNYIHILRLSNELLLMFLFNK